MELCPCNSSAMTSRARPSPSSKMGKLLFAKGYGYSDYEKKKPVSAEETLFRPGSVSKLFTWTAVMQLVEQGKLDLDRDVNDYLDFKIPDAFGQPITLKNILTHTPGFEEQIKDCLQSVPKAPILELPEDAHSAREYILREQCLLTQTTGRHWRDISSSVFQAVRSMNTSRRTFSSRSAWTHSTFASRCRPVWLRSCRMVTTGVRGAEAV